MRGKGRGTPLTQDRKPCALAQGFAARVVRLTRFVYIAINNETGAMKSSLAAVLLISLPMASGVSPAQQGTPSGAVIARAGDMFISEQEFLERYEMLPGFGRHRPSQAEAAKLELLYSIVAEKLLAQDAAAGGLERDTVVRLGVLETAKLLARDELYKREVIQNVVLSEGEIERGIAMAVLRLSIRYLFFTKEEDALFIRARVHGAADLQKLTIDTSFHALRDTATLLWGDADVRIEEAAYRLKRGDVSPVVAAGDGFYIFTVAGVGRNPYYAAMAPDVLRARVTTIIRRRKEHARLDEFLAGALRGRTGFAVPRALESLSSAIEKVYAGTGTDSIVYLTPGRETLLEKISAAELRDTLAVAGNRAWSVGEFIGRLSGEGFGVPRTSFRSIPFRLNTELMALVRRELMAQEALERGLDTLPDVRRQVGMWKDSFLASREREAIRKSVSVTDADVWSYLKSEDSSVAVPQVQVRELLTRTFEQMQGAMDDLGRGMSFAGVVQKWSVDPSARERGGLSTFFPVTARSPLGGIASRMKTGERYGPLSVPDGVLYFELAGKKLAPHAGDTSFAEKFSRAREEAREKMGRRAVTLRLSLLAKEKGVDVYTDRLKMLSVSRVPMMTFRILGFGGRMLAVPFVVPELDWLDFRESGREIQP